MFVTEGSADSDKEVAYGMYKLGHYQWSLFIWQLVVEKTLKAKIVSMDKDVPATHNLVRLAKDAELEISEKQKEDLEEITGFNLEARYDDYKRSFYKKATKEYTDIWAKKCEELYRWIKNQITK